MPSDKPFNLLAALRESDLRAADLEYDNDTLRGANRLLAYLLICAIFSLALILKTH